MSVGLILLSLVSVLVLFGAAQRVLDKMHLTDRAALLIAAAIFFGGLAPDIQVGRVAVNLGGAVVPLGVCVWLLIKADSREEALRALLEELFRSGAADFVNSGYFSFNEASAALHRKLGFREFFRHRIERNGEEIEVVETILFAGE